MSHKKDRTLQTDFSDLPLFGVFTPSGNQVEADVKSVTRPKSPDLKEPAAKRISSSKVVSKNISSENIKPSLKAQPPGSANVATGKVQLTHDALLICVSDMCKLLKVSRSTLIRMEKSGLIPGRITLGGSVRYHSQTVEAWLLGLIDTSHHKTA